MPLNSVPSDTESNVSGFIQYNDKNCKRLYTSVIQNMKIINQDIVEIEKNLRYMVQLSGPMESQLTALLQSFPRPKCNLPMETE